MTSELEAVRKRGHLIDEKIKALPIVSTDEIEDIASSQEAKLALTKLGVGLDVARVQTGKRVRSGAGKKRGRKYKIPRGPLIIVAKTGPITKAARNLGVNVVSVSKLCVEDLAPGTHPGRLTIWTESAINALKTLGWLGMEESQ